MKTLFTGIMVLVAMVTGTPLLQTGPDPQIEMRTLAEEVLQNSVKVFDYSGNLLVEMKADDVANDEISIKDYFILESSDFAFSYSGDYYYLRD